MGIFGDRTYSQHGDDIVLACIFDQLRIAKPSYLDIGAYHPFTLSNTALFYERGSSGINVEANPALIGEFQRARPRDVNVNCGVGPVRGVLPFYIYGTASGLDSFKKEWLEQRFHITEVKQVEVKTVADILETYHAGTFPELLSIDIEGMDIDVLQSIDFSQSAPLVIIAEAHRGAPESDQIRSVLERAGFFFLIRCTNNVVFVRNDLHSKLF